MKYEITRCDTLYISFCILHVLLFLLISIVSIPGRVVFPKFCTSNMCLHTNTTYCEKLKDFHCVVY